MTILKITKIKIKDSWLNQRVDKFLAGFRAEKSRASWQKMIKNKKILINNKEINPDYILKENDEIKIMPEEKIKDARTAEIPDIKITYEDEDAIVLDKPAKVLSQTAISSRSPSVSDFLVKHFPKIKKVGENEQRYGIVHRLDKDTSGIMIVAKNNNSFEFLKDQFKNRKVQKTYIALVYGNVEPKNGTIDLKIGRSKTNPQMQTVIDSEKKENIKSREALTLYKTIKKFKEYTLLEVQPKTGRTHQIRVHLKAIGYPVVGDKKYFFRKYSEVEPKLDRQFLHAKKLEIKLPNGNEKTFQSNLARDLESFLKKIE